MLTRGISLSTCIGSSIRLPPRFRAKLLQFFKALGRSSVVLGLGSSIAALGFRLIRGTTHYVFEPVDALQNMAALGPLIATTWHGQHFMIHVARPSKRPFSVMISRHRDGELNARVARKLGANIIRGSGGEAQDMHRKGAVSASREVLRALQQGSSIVMTADVPKIARKAGSGIIAMAQHSGCPIVPIAVVSKRRRDFDSWDHMSLPLPFSKGIVVVGRPIFVPADADAVELERKRCELETELNAIHVRAFTKMGSPHPIFAPGPYSGADT